MTAKIPTGTRGVAYVRISDDHQDMESQREIIRKWLTANGLRVGEWYEDVGSRHEAYKRHEFLKMMANVRAGRIDWIITDMKDRFGTRNGNEFGKFASELQENDVELWSVTGGNLTADDYATEILNAVDSVRSRDEQLARSKRALRGMILNWQEGRANGGYPPYGYDVACYSADGKEKWRVAYQGHHKRVKIHPDGREERYDGKANFPSRDQGEHLELVVSRDARQVEAVRKIFEWYTTESITYGAIATRLNDLGYSPLYSEAWYSNRVIRILANPAVLVGRSVGNKVSTGEFFEQRNGLPQRAPISKGRAVPNRQHPESDYVYPREWGEGLITQDTWDLARAKMKGGVKTRRSPRSPELWLGQFLYCSNCNQRMSGWTQRNHKSEPHSFVCSSFRRFSNRNKHGCRLHRVKYSEILPLVERWLKDAGHKLDEVLDAVPGSGLDAAIESKDQTERQYGKLITSVWRVVKEWGVKNPSGTTWAANTLSEAFRLHAPHHQSKERAALAKAKERYEEATEKYLELPPRAREVLRAKMEQMEGEISALEDRLRPLDEQLSELRGVLESARERVRAAEEACRGSGQRQKAQALSRVLARAVCHFEHYQTTPKKKQTPGQKGSERGMDRSRLVRVGFEPVLGEATVLRNDLCGSAHR